MHFLHEADLVFAVGSSLTKHGMVASIPPGKTIIHATNDERDINKNYRADHPILGDAQLVLGQLVEAVASLGRPPGRTARACAGEIEHVRERGSRSGCRS